LALVALQIQIATNLQLEDLVKQVQLLVLLQPLAAVVVELETMVVTNRQMDMLVVLAVEQVLVAEAQVVLVN
jgi:hypothetical protein